VNEVGLKQHDKREVIGSKVNGFTLLALLAIPQSREAWYNLGDWLDEQGRVEAAIECLRLRCGSRLTTPMQCSISRCFCNE
jgi:hypothetical protein